MEKPTKKAVKAAAEKARQLTLQDLEDKLATYKTCAVVRCTGFGKTWLLSRLTQKYKAVLYLYPSEVIRDTAIEVIKAMSGTSPQVQVNAEDFTFRNVRFMTYRKLVLLNNTELRELKKKFDLIIMDECHRLGAELTSDAIKKLLKGFKGHSIGALRLHRIVWTRLMWFRNSLAESAYILIRCIMPLRMESSRSLSTPTARMTSRPI